MAMMFHQTLYEKALPIHSILSFPLIMHSPFLHQLLAELTSPWLRCITYFSMAEMYYLFFKPLPVGDHTIDYHVIRAAPGEAVENDVSHWNIKGVPLITTSNACACEVVIL